MSTATIRHSRRESRDLDADAWQPPFPGPFSSTFRFGEWIPGPVTPLFEDWALTRMEAALHAAHYRWVGQPAAEPHHIVMNGWYFYSLRFLPVTVRALARWLPSMLPHLLRHPRRLAIVIPPTAHFAVDLYERDWREDILPRYQDAVESATSTDAPTAIEAMRLVDGLLDLAGEYFASLTVVAGSAYKAELQLASFYRKELAAALGGSHLSLLIGLADPGPAPEHAVTSLDWSAPTLGETRGPLRPVSTTATAELAARRRAHEDEARAELSASPRKQRRFDSLLARAQRLGPVREEQVRDLTLAWPAMRALLDGLGHGLVERGAIGEPADIHYLTRAEVEACVVGGRPALLDVPVSERRDAIETAANLVPPAYVGDMPPMLTRLLQTSSTILGATDGVGAVVHGTPVSPGTATGPVRVIHDASGFSSFAPGDVLVCPTTAPAWTPLFATAAAVVTDRGNALSHASVVAREYAIPAVVGCGDATRRLVDGQVVVVDGDVGSITLAG